MAEAAALRTVIVTVAGSSRVALEATTDGATRGVTDSTSTWEDTLATGVVAAVAGGSPPPRIATMATMAAIAPPPTSHSQVGALPVSSPPMVWLDAGGRVSDRRLSAGCVAAEAKAPIGL